MSHSPQSPALPPSKIPLYQTDRQELVRDYVREARRKIEARAGLTPTDGAWPSTILPRSPLQTPPPSGADFSPVSSTRSPLLADGGHALRPEPPRTPESPNLASSSSRLPVPSKTPPPSAEWHLMPRTLDQPGSVSPTRLPIPSKTPPPAERGAKRRGSPPKAVSTQQASASPSRRQGPSADGLPEGPVSRQPYAVASPTRSQTSLASSSDSLVDPAFPSSPQARKSPALGPPPSARRGPPSAYTPNVFVTPILEETDTGRANPSTSAGGRRTNRAVHDPQNAAIPALDADDASFTDPALRPPIKFAPDSDNVVKQVEVARKQRPSLTTIKSGDKLQLIERSSSLALFPTPKTAQMSRTASLQSLPHSLSSIRSRGSEPGPAPGFFGSDAVLLESRPSQESLASQRKDSDASAAFVDSPAPKSMMPVTPVTPKSPLIPMENLSSTGNSRASSLHRSKSIASRYSVRPRPLGNHDGDSQPLTEDEEPRHGLGISTPPVRQLESRSSTTPLPDLIKRAMRLASNLESGTRSYSRASAPFGAEPATDESGRDRPNAHRRSSSASEALKTEESPRTLVGDISPAAKAQIPLSDWQDTLSPTKYGTPGYTPGYTPAYTSRDSPGRHVRTPPPARRRRRCCGMPLLAFILVIVGVLILTAIAVIVPVVLIVLPKHNSTAPSNPSSQSCLQTLTCANGGTSVAGTDGTCRCLCVNGFTGPTCTQTGASSCVTTQIGDIPKATVGSAVPRLLDEAEGTFQVDLHSTTLLSIFSSADISCNTQNALVTFNGLATRSERRQQQYTDSKSLDFGRISVLYVLQEVTTLAAAAAAQSGLQTFFGDPGDGNPSSVDLGNSFTANIANLTISQNGQVVAGP